MNLPGFDVKILAFGLPGSGKTVLSNCLSELTGVAVSWIVDGNGMALWKCVSKKLIWLFIAAF